MLDRVTIHKLQSLIRTNLDSYNVLTEGCEGLQSTAVGEGLRRLALEYVRNAEELKRLVIEENVAPEIAGTLDGTARASWLAVRVAFESDDIGAVLAESERMARQVKQEYQNSISATRSLSELLPKQYARVKRAFDSVRAMRARSRAS